MDSWSRKFRSVRPPLVTRPTMNKIYVIFVVTILALVTITSYFFEHGKKVRYRHKPLPHELTDGDVGYVLDGVNATLDDYDDLLSIEKPLQDSDPNERSNEDVEEEDYNEEEEEDDFEEEDEEEDEEPHFMEPCPHPPMPKCCDIFAKVTQGKNNMTVIRFSGNGTMIMTWKSENTSAFGVLLPNCTLVPGPTPDLLEALEQLPMGTILVGAADAEYSKPLKKAIQKMETFKEGVFAFVLVNGNRGDSWYSKFDKGNNWWIETWFSNAINISYDLPSWQDLNNDSLREPANCVPLYNVAIIVPYRQRENHLKMFINNMDTILSNQSISFTIYVVEHTCPTLFNRAILHNIGYTEAKSEQNFDCYVFHDVDLIPEKMENYYHCGNSPQHLVVTRNRTKYIMFSTRYFGGGVMFSPEHYESINGFTNKIFGWGGEDNNAYYRVLDRNLTIYRYPGSVASYTMFEHGWDAANARNNLIVEKKEALDPTRDPIIPWVYDSQYRPENDGLSTLEYSLIWRKQFPRFTHLFADISGPVVENSTDCEDSSTVVIG